MAYSNAIYYIDLVNGNDAARTALTNCIASNPSGTITRITKTGHGLITGAVVDLTAFSTWLNSSWKITKVDDDTFDLDGAVWQTTADNNGTVTPRGGSFWADAWKTITSGATAARVSPGDTIRVSKSPDPVSIGNATWTDKSKTVTLATAQTQLIDNCETAWTVTNGGTVTRESAASDGKEGSYCMRITVPASPVANTKYASFTLPALDLSSFQKITFWLKASAVVLANQWKICLCSDTTGDTIVDVIDIPAIPSASVWIPFTLARTGGGNLASSIQSIAVYTGSALPNASSYLKLDNINACTDAGLNLQSLISKNGNAICGDEPWWVIQSINGTTVLLDLLNASKPTEGRGYSGTTETVATYMRETVKPSSLPATSSAYINNVQGQGMPTGGFVYYKFGWDTANTEQNGETFFDGLNGNGYCLYIQKVYVDIDRFSCVRCYTGLYNMSAIWGAATIGNIAGCTSGIQTGNTSKNTFTGYTIVQCQVAINLSTSYDNKFFINNANSCNNSFAFGVSQNNVFYNITLKNNAQNGTLTGGTNWFYNPTVALGETIAQTFSLYSDGELRIVNRNGVAGANSILAYNAYFTRITSIAHDTDPGAWEWEINNSLRSPLFQSRIKLAEAAVDANKLVTVTCWMKNKYLTGVGKLMTPDNILIGVTYASTQKSRLDYDWENVTLQFTPTTAGVAEIYLEGYFDGGSLGIYVGSISIQQA